MTAERLPTMTPCLNCRKPLDAATCNDLKSTPSVGDVTICLYCGEIMQFGLGLVLQPLSSEAMHAVAGDKRIIMMQRVRSMALDNMKRKQ